MGRSTKQRRSAKRRASAVVRRRRDWAIALAESGWWRKKTPREIVAFQLFEDLLCMSFGDYHRAVEIVLGRPVWTHEFAYGDRLRAEFLGRKRRPYMSEILDLIPAEKRIVVVAGGQS